MLDHISKSVNVFLNIISYFYFEDEENLGHFLLKIIEYPTPEKKDRRRIKFEVYFNRTCNS